MLFNKPVIINFYNALFGFASFLKGLRSLFGKFFMVWRQFLKFGWAIFTYFIFLRFLNLSISAPLNFRFLRRFTFFNKQFEFFHLFSLLCFLGLFIWFWITLMLIWSLFLLLLHSFFIWNRSILNRFLWLIEITSLSCLLVSFRLCWWINWIKFIR